MTNRFRVIALLAAVLAVGGCNDDEFLTEVPGDFIAPENFYRNAGDALAAVNAAYATFINLQSPLGNDDYYGRNFFMLAEFPTEAVTNRLSATNERSLPDGFHTQFTSSHAYIETVWFAAYSGINRANSVIARVPNVPMDATRRDQIVAEAKFLRALHYYNLAGFFGGVPLKLEETVGLGNLELPRATATETYDQIIQDLVEAAAVLPVSWPASDYGRVTRGAALGLMGRAYLQKAQTGAGTAADFQAARDTLAKLLASPFSYALDANYAGLFDGTNERSSEVVFSLQNVRVVGFGGVQSQWTAPNPTRPGNTIIFPGALNHYQAERPFYDTYASTDVRKEGTWLVSYIQSDTVLTWNWTWATSALRNNMRDSYGSTGPANKKYLDRGAPAEGAEEPDYMIIRFADVLLMLAEAENEVAGPAGAYTYVDQVRAIRGLPAMPGGLAKQAFEDSLFGERRREVVMEGHGVFDSRRNWEWAKGRVIAHMLMRFAPTNLNASPFTSSVPKFIPPSNTAAGAQIDDKWKLYPIPERACQLNDLLTQNPGWEEGSCEGFMTP